MLLRYIFEQQMFIKCSTVLEFLSSNEQLLTSSIVVVMIVILGNNDTGVKQIKSALMILLHTIAF